MKVVMVKGPRQNSRKPKRNGTKVLGNSSQPGMVLYKKIRDRYSVLRVLRNLGQVTANASGFVTLTNLVSSSVTSNSDWGNIAQEFQEYRIRQMKLKLFPAYNCSSAKTGGNDYPQGVLLCSLYWQQGPTSISNVVQTPDMKAFHSSKEHTISNNFLGFENGQLWTDTSTVIASTNTYGISLISSASMTAFEASSPVFNYILEFDIEFNAEK